MTIKELIEALTPYLSIENDIEFEHRINHASGYAELEFDRVEMFRGRPIIVLKENKR